MFFLCLVILEMVMNMKKDRQMLSSILKTAQTGQISIQKVLDTSMRPGLRKALQAQLQETKIKSAAKVGFLAAKALDIDYLTFKLNEKLKAEGKTLELDENDNIKGWDDIRSDLKTQFPAQFEAAKGGKVIPNILPTGEERKATPQSLADALRMEYETK